MQNEFYRQRGTVLIFLLVLIGLITAVSGVMLKDVFYDRILLEIQLNRSQLDLLSSDLARESVQKRFGEGSDPMFASFVDSNTNYRERYEMMIKPTGQSVSFSVQTSPLKKINTQE